MARLQSPLSTFCLQNSVPMFKRKCESRRKVRRSNWVRAGRIDSIRFMISFWPEGRRDAMGIAMGFRSQPHRSNPLLSFNIALLYLLRMRPSPQVGPLLWTPPAGTYLRRLVVVWSSFSAVQSMANCIVQTSCFFIPPTEINIDIQAQWRRRARNAAQLE